MGGRRRRWRAGPLTVGRKAGWRPAGRQGSFGLEPPALDRTVGHAPARWARVAEHPASGSAIPIRPIGITVARLLATAGCRIAIDGTQQTGPVVGRRRRIQDLSSCGQELRTVPHAGVHFEAAGIGHGRRAGVNDHRHAGSTAGAGRAGGTGCRPCGGCDPRRRHQGRQSEDGCPASHLIPIRRRAISSSAPSAGHGDRLCASATACMVLSRARRREESPAPNRASSTVDLGAHGPGIPACEDWPHLRLRVSAGI